MALHLTFFDKVVKIIYEQDYYENSDIVRLQNEFHGSKYKQITLLLSDYIQDTYAAPFDDPIKKETMDELSDIIAKEQSLATADVKQNLFCLGSKVAKDNVEEYISQTMEYNKVAPSVFSKYADTIRFILSMSRYSNVVFLDNPSSLSMDIFVDTLKDMLRNVKQMDVVKKMKVYNLEEEETGFTSNVCYDTLCGGCEDEAKCPLCRQAYTSVMFTLQGQGHGQNIGIEPIAFYSGNNTFEEFIPEEEFIPNNAKDNVTYLFYDKLNSACKLIINSDINYEVCKTYFPEMEYINKIFYEDSAGFEFIESVFITRDYKDAQRVRSVLDALEFVGQLRTTSRDMTIADMDTLKTVVDTLFVRSEYSMYGVENAFTLVKEELTEKKIHFLNYKLKKDLLEVFGGMTGVSVVSSEDGKQNYVGIKRKRQIEFESDSISLRYEEKTRDYSFSSPSANA